MIDLLQIRYKLDIGLYMVSGANRRPIDIGFSAIIA